jgi:hypothetical protein
MPPPNEALLKRTVELWQPQTERAFNAEDARVAIENVTGFFDLLERWAEASPDFRGDNHLEMETT